MSQCCPFLLHAQEPRLLSGSGTLFLRAVDLSLDQHFFFLTCAVVSGSMSKSVIRKDVKGPLDGSTDQGLGSVEQDVPPLHNYLVLTIFTCFCPAYPVNIVALVFSVMSQTSYDQGDYEGSKRLGRKALQLGIASIAIGLTIITIYVIVHFTTHVV